MTSATTASGSTGDPRCSAASRDRGESLAGTASTLRPFLLVENDGPWGLEALRDARMDAVALERLRTDADAAGVRALLVRRYGRTSGPSRLRVVAAYADPVAPWAEQIELDSPGELATLDLTALGAGRSTGLDPVNVPVFAVCTHGRHDTCCAEQGRPVADALSQRHPDRTWECSHIGGDRYAGNMLVLPYGLYYGRLDPQAADHVAAEITQGRLELDHLRGRSGYPMAVQAAEIALRRELGELRIDALRLLRRRRGGEITETTWELTDDPSDDQRYDVTIRTTLGDPAFLTCRAIQTNPTPRHELVAIRPRLGEVVER